VDFTFTDNKEPFSQVDCCPLEFVAEHLVDEAAARKWTVAVAKQSEFDSPVTKQKKKILLLPRSEIREKGSKLL